MNNEAKDRRPRTKLRQWPISCGASRRQIAALAEFMQSEAKYSQRLRRIAAVGCRLLRNDKSSVAFSVAKKDKTKMAKSMIGL